MKRETSEEGGKVERAEEEMREEEEEEKEKVISTYACWSKLYAVPIPAKVYTTVDFLLKKFEDRL